MSIGFALNCFGWMNLISDFGIAVKGVGAGCVNIEAPGLQRSRWESRQ